MGKKIILSEIMRCMECNRKYTANRFPEVKFNCLMPKAVTEEQKDGVLKNLALSLSSFADYVYLMYQLDAHHVEIQIDFDPVKNVASES